MRAFFRSFPRLFLGLRTSCQCRSRSSFSRLSSRSFPRGCTPTHPFVNPSAVKGGRSGPQEPDTEYSAATVSLCMAVSFRVTLGQCRRVHGALQTGLAGEGLSPSRRADATVAPTFPLSCVCFPRGSREPLPPSPSPRSSPRAYWDRGDGEGGKGRPPFAEPEPRGRTTPPRLGVSAAADHPPRTPPCSSPCAKSPSPTDALPPPARSLIRDAA